MDNEIIRNITDYCVACPFLKRCKVFTFDELNGTSSSVICDPWEARAMLINDTNNSISDVWCSGCGLKYHTRSV